MSNNMFSTKKMELKKPNWLKKSLIGTTILAVIGALGFGVYQAAGTSSVSPREQRQHRLSYARQHDSVPAFATKSVAAKSKSKKSVAAKLHKKKHSKKLALNNKKSAKKLAAHKKRGKAYKADLSKLNKKSKKHLAKSKKSKRHAKHLAAE
jgi:hypothetical protein